MHFPVHLQPLIVAGRDSIGIRNWKRLHFNNSRPMLPFEETARPRRALAVPAFAQRERKKVVGGASARAALPLLVRSFVR